MGDINLLAVFVAALAFLAVSVVWYAVLFRRSSQCALISRQQQLRAGRPIWLTLVLVFLFELLISVMMGHMFARLQPVPHLIMMLSTGMGAALMTPALGIAYLFQRRPGKLFAIDAGHLIVGMTVVGLVFLAF